MNRRYSKTIYAGTLAIGGNAPISVQSMLNAAADDIVGNVAQAIALEQAGCQWCVSQFQIKMQLL